jgi:Tfp pilus assembly protein PilZ
MAATTSRREPRYLVHLPILLTAEGKSVSLVTEDVSRGGVFLRTEATLSPRQLVHVEIVLPPRAERFLGTARLTHAVPRGLEGRVPGVGLELDAIGPEVQPIWDRFIEHVRKSCPEAGERAQLEARGETFEPLHRRHTKEVVLRIHPVNLADLCSLHERDVARGGMFLLTDGTFALGDEVGLQLIHPHTMDVFEARCVVRRTVSEHGISGIGVDFLDPEETSRRCYDFIYDGIAALFDDESIVDEDG